LQIVGNMRVDSRVQPRVGRKSITGEEKREVAYGPDPRTCYMTKWAVSPEDGPYPRAGRSTELDNGVRPNTSGCY